MPESKKSKTDAINILHRRFYEGKPGRLESLEETRANEQVARSIRTLRTNAGLTQTQLARIVGTTASAI
jgi:DNA-binding transcriptional regulator YiaG